MSWVEQQDSNNCKCVHNSSNLLTNKAMAVNTLF
jgi:hypothetical protein